MGSSPVEPQCLLIHKGEKGGNYNGTAKCFSQRRVALLLLPVHNGLNGILFQSSLNDFFNFPEAAVGILQFVPVGIESLLFTDHSALTGLPAEMEVQIQILHLVLLFQDPVENSKFLFCGNFQQRCCKLEGKYKGQVFIQVQIAMLGIQQTGIQKMQEILYKLLFFVGEKYCSS